MINRDQPIALYCPELKELMIDSGRIYLVPDQIAVTVKKDNPDTRFVKQWAVMHRLISPAGAVTVLEAVQTEAA
ncbi:hypothetical protein FEV13_00305 (plasmid) [Stutzerimonas degradans]|nr:hypothetical protein FEV13_00305 [Stutzerimonas degradans]